MKKVPNLVSMDAQLYEKSEKIVSWGFPGLWVFPYFLSLAHCAQWAVKGEKWKFWVSGPKSTRLNGFKRLEAAFYDGKTKKIKKPKKFLSFWVFPQKQDFCDFCVFWRKKAIEIDWKRFQASNLLVAKAKWSKFVKMQKNRPKNVIFWHF